MRGQAAEEKELDKPRRRVRSGSVQAYERETAIKSAQLSVAQHEVKTGKASLSARKSEGPR